MVGIVVGAGPGLELFARPCSVTVPDSGSVVGLGSGSPAGSEPGLFACPGSGLVTELGSGSIAGPVVGSPVGPVWKTLLSACRTRGNLEIGKRAAESILNMDSSNSTAHVLLCNIYASLGRWDDVARFRKLMKSRNVMKIPGQSWIEVKEGVQLFSVEDNSHPKTNEIYTLLEELWLQMMEDGYIPDQRFTSIEPIA
ncbi:hypothetical protein GIB67_028131 [Kingdonia uniflora]|uniref:Pentatricopeptide repeat-containing protein n=1 Tax=Kingdonia uniflora TaxID=39325 RepID=A0A7J7KZT4_9MAGN|nr:hypothetical protein GIB67_028131 [Kingdonia uniflora]